MSAPEKAPSLARWLRSVGRETSEDRANRRAGLLKAGPSFVAAQRNDFYDDDLTDAELASADAECAEHIRRSTVIASSEEV